MEDSNNPINFTYDDTDSYQNEISELYSYGEESDFLANRNAFEESMEDCGLPLTWKHMVQEQQSRAINYLMTTLEVSCRVTRLKSCRALAYLIQGNFGECLTLEEQANNSKENVFLLYGHGIFQAFVQQLLIAANLNPNNTSDESNQQPQEMNGIHLPAPSSKVFNDSSELRLILSVLCTITETMYHAKDSDDPKIQDMRQQFILELQCPFGDELLVVTLFQMLNNFCGGLGPHFPIRKITLLLWKIILITLGGWDTLRELKKTYRSAANLELAPDDTIEVTKTMQPCSYQAIPDRQALAKTALSLQNKRRVFKQTAFDDVVYAYVEECISQLPKNSEANELEQPVTETETSDDSGQFSNETNEVNEISDTDNKPDAESSTGLPWASKVRKADLTQHLSNIRQKFLGYTLPNDLETTFGLPDPIVEGVMVLKKHLYTTLAEVQLDREEAMEKYPLTHKEINPKYRDQPAEKLYRALLPRLPQYMIALLKILLASSTSSKNKAERSESINIMSEMNPENGNSSIIQTMKMTADTNRHKEIIIKAVSAILILLLKHLKINHIYQFEYVSQQLMFANCIPLILKFLSQDIYSYIVTSKSTISAIDFPACVIGEQPELTTEAIELCSFQPYCWRNMFSCINLVRLLNKLTKWKHSRIMMLVVFKSAPTLSKALSVRHALFQLYILKLLKVQLKFLGRQWKKTNMKLISAIYQKVRHRLTDDWAYSNDNEARPWDFQAEEFALQANINKFHQRRYKNLLTANNKSKASLMLNQAEKLSGHEEAIDEDYDFGLNDISQISPHFERNYERWLESEVFQRRIDWDKLLVD